MWDEYGPNAISHAIAIEANKLVEEGFASMKTGTSIYGTDTFLYSLGPKKTDIAECLISPIERQALLDTVKRYPGITQKELIITAGLKRITVGHNIKKLIDFGIVRKEPNGRNMCYFYISDVELKERIRKRLITKFLNNEIDEQTFLALKRKLDKDMI